MVVRGGLHSVYVPQVEAAPSVSLVAWYICSAQHKKVRCSLPLAPVRSHSAISVGPPKFWARVPRPKLGQSMKIRSTSSGYSSAYLANKRHHGQAHTYGMKKAGEDKIRACFVPRRISKASTYVVRGTTFDPSRTICAQ